jgi:hypothetical protein
VVGSAADDHIDPAVARADLDRAVADADRVRVFAERTRAHRTPNQGIDNALTFRGLHEAIANIRTVVEKYQLLLTLTTTLNWEPVAQYDQIEAFERAWVTDRAAVERAADENQPDAQEPNELERTSKPESDASSTAPARRRQLKPLGAHTRQMGCARTKAARRHPGMNLFTPRNLRQFPCTGQELSP